jgi:CRP/FNR family cyclic AMP-dependent transcriptional regulator
VVTPGGTSGYVEQRSRVPDAVVRLLDVDLDLAEALDPRTRRQARPYAIARVDTIPRGAWDPRTRYRNPEEILGLLVLDGLATREAVIEGRSTTELLGRRDLLRPWEEDGAFSPLPFEVRWEVLETLEVAVLDRRFQLMCARWPALLNALVGRSIQRCRWLVTQMAIGHVLRVETRLLLVLWQLAERFGTVSSDGVRLPLRLTHDLLGRLVGARRPSVTSALGNLQERGLVERGDGYWLLLNGPPTAGLLNENSGDEPSPANGVGSEPTTAARA